MSTNKTGPAVPLLFLIPVLALCVRPASAQVLTYEFNDTLAADQAGGPALTATDPLASNSFTTDTVFGNTRTVYSTVGNTTPLQQAGLTLDTTGQLTADNIYSVVLITETTEGDNAWRRLEDVQNRQSDDGFYVDPNNQLDIFPVTGASAPFVKNVYHDVVLTVDNGTVQAYLDGILDFTASTTVMDINNPGNLINFYLDNVTGGGQGEYSNANTALIELYNSALTQSQVTTQFDNPFPAQQIPNGTPEPGALALFGGMIVSGLACARRKRAS